MRLTISSSFLAALHQSKTKKLNCYLYLLIWIVFVSFVLYWLLTNASFKSPSSRNNGLPYLPSRLNANATATRFQLKSPVIPLMKKPLLLISDEDNAGEKSKSVDILDLKELNARNYDIYSNNVAGAGNELESYSTLTATSTERVCNSPEKIVAEDENWEHPEYKLDGIIILLRHGDRGPLTHVGQHNVSHINCQGNNRRNDVNVDLKNLIKYTETMTKLPGYSQFIGPFHSFPKIPTSRSCHLGQLTQLGSTQLIYLGKIIRQAYQSALFYDVNNNVPSTKLFKIISYSTRYRRTLQSLMSFLYGLLGPKYIIPNVVVRESQSITFCFNDCSCKLVERLKKIAAKSYQSIPEDKLEMTALVNKLNSILGITRNKRTSTSLLDLLLIYSCHNATLPCHHHSKLKYFPLSSDQSPNCITTKDVTTLINLIQKETFSLKPISTNYHYSLLSAYGLIKEIINLALKMASSSTEENSSQRNSRIAIFSGHDTTLQGLLGALGIFQDHPDLRLPPYASRFIFEFYRKTKNISPENSARKYHFRAIYNGISVTHLISFCKIKLNDGEKEATNTNTKQYFCPLENLVRFLHDNYFERFGNSTNFRDACQY